jgi:hypothetical protein
MGIFLDAHSAIVSLPPFLAYARKLWGSGFLENFNKMSWNVGESGTDVVRGIYKGGMLEDIVGVYF